MKLEFMASISLYALGTTQPILSFRLKEYQ